jgi:hypothetical protein
MHVNGLFHAPAALLKLKELPSTCCIERWVEPTTDLDVMVRGHFLTELTELTSVYCNALTVAV